MQAVDCRERRVQQAGENVRGRVAKRAVDATGQAVERLPGPGQFQEWDDDARGTSAFRKSFSCGRPVEDRRANCKEAVPMRLAQPRAVDRARAATSSSRSSCRASTKMCSHLD